MVLYGWPYAGLVFAVLLLAVLEFDRRRHAETFSDPAIVLGYLWPIYLVHQFEEHGIDLFGRHFHFVHDLCGMLGRAVTECPADAGFIFAVNPGTCWIAFGIALAARRLRPEFAIAAWGIPAVNFFSHIGSALSSGAYNSGTLTCLVLFLPGVVWLLVVLFRADWSKGRSIALVFVSGVVLHVVLIGSLVAALAGVIGSGTLYAVNVLNGFTPVCIAVMLSPRSSKPLGRSTTG
ncbi:MAG: HXXEE domain-containing protein [Myxococcota bacterium]